MEKLSKTLHLGHRSSIQTLRSKNGVYKFDLKYLTGDTNRPMSITVNNYDPVTVHFRKQQQHGAIRQMPILQRLIYILMVGKTK